MRTGTRTPHLCASSPSQAPVASTTALALTVCPFADSTVYAYSCLRIAATSNRCRIVPPRLTTARASDSTNRPGSTYRWPSIRMPAPIRSATCGKCSRSSGPASWVQDTFCPASPSRSSSLTSVCAFADVSNSAVMGASMVGASTPFEVRMSNASRHCSLNGRFARTARFQDRWVQFAAKRARNCHSRGSGVAGTCSGACRSSRVRRP